jgi:heme-degrading monooxygenase HmoA
MIARVWTARAAEANAAAHREHFAQQVLPAVRTIAGYAGATLLTRATDDTIEITVITRWHSLEAIRAFAGDDIESAVVADAAVSLLDAWDRRVRHYEVILDE